MRKSLILVLLFIIGIAMAAAGCTSQQNTTKTVVTPTVTIAVPDANASQAAFLALPQAPLNVTETEDILDMQEAEKLTHDLNAALYGMHNDLPVFRHIATAAKVYMAADNVILQRYEIANPENVTEGVFTNRYTSRSTQPISIPACHRQPMHSSTA